MMNTFIKKRSNIETKSIKSSHKMSSTQESRHFQDLIHVDNLLLSNSKFPIFKYYDEFIMNIDTILNFLKLSDSNVNISQIDVLFFYRIYRFTDLYSLFWLILDCKRNAGSASSINFLREFEKLFKKFNITFYKKKFKGKFSELCHFYSNPSKNPASEITHLMDGGRYYDLSYYKGILVMYYLLTDLVDPTGNNRLICKIGYTSNIKARIETFEYLLLCNIFVISIKCIDDRKTEKKFHKSITDHLKDVVCDYNDYKYIFLSGLYNIPHKFQSLLTSRFRHYHPLFIKDFYFMPKTEFYYHDNRLLKRFNNIQEVDPETLYYYNFKDDYDDCFSDSLNKFLSEKSTVKKVDPKILYYDDFMDDYDDCFSYSLNKFLYEKSTVKKVDRKITTIKTEPCKV